MPSGIAERLEPAQMKAVVADESRHARRLTLTATLHMLVEALFWFHPLVWWIGARLIAERELACDEAVLSLGNEPQTYAEAILNVCKNYLEIPLTCAAGVTGSDLKKRIQAILKGCVARDLTVTKKLVLAGTAFAVFGLPVMVGVLGAPQVVAQSRIPTPLPTYLHSHLSRFSQRRSPGLGSRNTTLRMHNGGAFHSASVRPLRRRQHEFCVIARCQRGPSLDHIESLRDRCESGWKYGAHRDEWPGSKGHSRTGFKLKLHMESREVPVYALTVAAVVRNFSRLLVPALPGISTTYLRLKIAAPPSYIRVDLHSKLLPLQTFAQASLYC